MKAAAVQHSKDHKPIRLLILYLVSSGGKGFLDIGQLHLDRVLSNFRKPQVFVLNPIDMKLDDKNNALRMLVENGGSRFTMAENSVHFREAYQFMKKVYAHLFSWLGVYINDVLRSYLKVHRWGNDG